MQMGVPAEQFPGHRAVRQLRDAQAPSPGGVPEGSGGGGETGREYEAHGHGSCRSGAGAAHRISVDNPRRVRLPWAGCTPTGRTRTRRSYDACSPHSFPTGRIFPSSGSDPTERSTPSTGWGRNWRCGCHASRAARRTLRRSTAGCPASPSAFPSPSPSRWPRACPRRATPGHGRSAAGSTATTRPSVRAAPASPPTSRNSSWRCAASTPPTPRPPTAVNRLPHGTRPPGALWTRCTASSTSRGRQPSGPTPWAPPARRARPCGSTEICSRATSWSRAAGSARSSTSVAWGSPTPRST